MEQKPTSLKGIGSERRNSALGGLVKTQRMNVVSQSPSNNILTDTLKNKKIRAEYKFDS